MDNSNNDNNIKDNLTDSNNTCENDFEKKSNNFDCSSHKEKNQPNNIYDDLNFCVEVALKEATKEEKMVKQVLYTMLSAYTNNPINLAINAPSGEGKTHVLTVVSNLFPKEDIVIIAGMSSKAIFHKNGYVAVRNEDGDYKEVENEIEILKQTIRTKEKELKNIDKQNSSTFDEIKKEYDGCKIRLKEIEKCCEGYRSES